MWKVNCEARFLVKYTSRDIDLFLRNLKDSFWYIAHILSKVSVNTRCNMFSLLRSAQVLRLIALVHEKKSKIKKKLKMKIIICNIVQPNLINVYIVSISLHNFDFYTIIFM